MSRQEGEGARHKSPRYRKMCAFVPSGRSRSNRFGVDPYAPARHLCHMSRTRTIYKGQIIEVTALASDGTRFTVHFDIEKPDGGGVTVTHFESGQLFGSDREALDAGLQMGKVKIDIGYDSGIPVVNK